jgi:putative peptide zinc metalloprotease protein
MLETTAPETAGATRAGGGTAEPQTDPPALAPGVELVGEMPETGFQDRQWLVVRNGQFVQLTELLYRICEQCDGEHTLEHIAEAVSASTDWSLDASQVELVINKKLAPIGLVWTDSEMVEASGDRAASPLRLQLRTKAVGPALIDPVTGVFQMLFAPLLLLPLLGLVVVAHAWLYVVHGMSNTLLTMFRTPVSVLVVVPVLLVGMAFHELGHASALRHGGGRVRGMGVGLYLIFPAFYTDTTDAYRLTRWARVRTDLGGFYFTLIFALGLIGLYAATGLEVVLIPVVLLDLDIVYQCLPFVRLDGYWALADLTGIPDFFSLMVPFVASITPRRPLVATKLPQLRRGARTVFLLYTVLVLPLLALVIIFALTRLPWLLATTWDSEQVQQQLFMLALDAGDHGAAILSLVQMLLLLIPALGSVYFLYSLGCPALRFAYRWSASRLAPAHAHGGSS